jgi:hypothetical protein
MKSFFFITGLFIVWLLTQIFSHQYMAVKINHDNQIKRQQLKQGSYQKNIKKLTLDDVISSFQGDWINSDEGIVSVKKDPEVSIELNDFYIVPSFHHSLVVDAAVETSSSNARFKIELSNQEEQIYYHSDAFNINQLGQPLDLTATQWQVITSKNGTAVENPNPWSKLPSFDALVIRFYEAEMVYFKQINVPQYKAITLAERSISRCDYANVKCFNNNHKNFMEKLWNLENGVSMTDYQLMTKLPPLSWLLVSGLLLCFMLFFIQGFSAKLIGFIVFIFISIAVLHQHIVATHAVWLKWILIPAIVMLLWMKKTVLFKSKKVALNVYILSLALATVMVLITQTTPDFVLQLPGYFIWAMIQQMILGPILSDLIKRESNAANIEIAITVGVLFSIVHAPNHTLMLATLLGGVFWSYSWLKYQNLYANAFSHAILALVFYAVMPVAWLGSARIGVFF